MRNTRVIIHTKRLISNISMVTQASGGTALCAAVKANAYGHGAVECARIALRNGVTALGVSCAAEGFELRRAGISSPILMYGLPFAEDCNQLVDQEIEPFCADLGHLQAMADAAHRCGKPGLVHIKVDTGMGRIGCTPSQAADLARFACDPENKLEFRGLCTHFPISDNDDGSFTAKQTALMLKLKEELTGLGLKPAKVHASNSGGILDFPQARFDMVRPGIILYGYPEPSETIQRSGLEFLPVMEVRSRISFVKEVAEGTTVSYGRRWAAPGPRWIGTVAIGYADGLPRAASSKIHFTDLEGSQSWPQVGTICMDQCMIDLGPSRDNQGKMLPCTASIGQELVIFGSARGKAMSAQDLARAAGTISYEICCGINARIAREYQD